MKDSKPNGYELSHIPAAPAVASPQYFLSQVLDRLAVLEERDHQREEELIDLREENRQLREEVALERAYDRQRLARLENPEVTASPSEKTEAHVNHVRALLLKADFHRETVKFLGSRLGVSKRQTWNIIYEMERRGLVNVIWDPHHKQRRLVELR